MSLVSSNSAAKWVQTSDGGVTDEGVARAVDAEERARCWRGVIDRLGEEQRAGGVRALLHDLFVKLPRVEHSTVADCEDDGGARGDFGRHRDAGVFERGEAAATASWLMVLARRSLGFRARWATASG
jgi:hypothetical protein